MTRRLDTLRIPVDAPDAVIEAALDALDLEAATDAAEAAAWDEDMEQLRWAECGGYAAGLPRPVSRREAAAWRLNDGAGDWGDIPF